MNEINAIESEYLRDDLPDFNSGDLIRITTTVKRGDKMRLHRFEGRVISIRGSGTGKTFTVRKTSQGIGIEKMFPYNSPIIESIDVLKKGKVRRSKLYYLRERQGKAARIKEQK